VTKGWLSVGTGVNADGRIELFGLTPDGDVWRRAQFDAARETWSNWTQLNRPGDGLLVARAMVAHNATDRMELIVTTTDGQVFYRSQTSPGARTWGNWTRITPPGDGKLRSIGAVADTDHRIQVLGVDDAGQVWQVGQNSATDNNWSGFTKLAGFGMVGVTLTHNHNGTLELVGVDNLGNMWQSAQTGTDSTTYTGWTKVDGQLRP
jgi:hypothetical protein